VPTVDAQKKSSVGVPKWTLGLRRFIIEHHAAHGADKKRKAFITGGDHFIGKPLSYERNFVNAANRRM